MPFVQSQSYGIWDTLNGETLRLFDQADVFVFHRLVYPLQDKEGRLPSNYDASHRGGLNFGRDGHSKR